MRRPPSKRRRAGTALFLFLILGCGVAFTAHGASAQSKASDFKEANALYESGKFKEAAERYGSIAEEKRGGAAVFYNLGNAELRAGRKGKARVWYERALKIKPRDADILWNLQILKNALTDRVDPPADPFGVVEIYKKITDFFSINEAGSILTSFLFLLAVVSLLAWICPPARCSGRAAQGPLLVLILIVAGLFLIKWTRVKEPRVVVLSKEAAAHYGPSAKETKAFVLHEGSEARVLDQTKDWFYIRFDNGSEGWLPKDSCEMV